MILELSILIVVLQLFTAYVRLLFVLLHVLYLFEILQKVVFMVDPSASIYK